MKTDYSLDEIKALVVRCLQELLANDSHLLEVDAHELSINHKFGEYLQNAFKGWKVDSEYNRDGKIIKKDKYGDNIRPDLIAHIRGQGGPNLLIIEIKKSDNYSDRKKDINRICEMTGLDDHYKYQFGAFVDIDTGNSKNSHIIRWFAAGKELSI